MNNTLDKLLRTGLTSYPCLNELIKENDILKWSRLVNISAPLDYVNQNSFNLLSSIIVSAFKVELTENLITNHAITYLNTIEKALKSFPRLRSENAFARNIKILITESFLSFLSELSLALYFEEKGAKIDFNKRYRKVAKGKIVDRDIDLELKFSSGSHSYVEVYTNFNFAEIDGFYDPNQLSKEMQQDIKAKGYNKFSNLLEGQFNGKIFLAVNFAFEDNFKLGLLSGATISIQAFEKFFGMEVDGIILFHQDFSNESSVQISYFIPKN